MIKKIEEQCTKLFGECPLTINDIAIGISSGYTLDDFICEAAKKYCTKTRRDFSTALDDWMKGNKLEISREEAIKRNKYFKTAQAIISKSKFPPFHSIINWLAFPDDNPEICFYMGYSFDSNICKWAREYINKKKNCNVV